jgi:hypothetical protein
LLAREIEPFGSAGLQKPEHGSSSRKPASPRASNRRGFIRREKQQRHRIGGNRRLLVTLYLIRHYGDKTV